MTHKKIITVFGATGAQGGSLARAILSDTSSEFAVRAVTRDPQSDKAKELAGLGAEVVTADVDDVQSIKDTLKGSYGAFFVTFFWHLLSGEKEYEQARNYVMAARDSGLRHIIWSTLEDTRNFIPLDDGRMPILEGKYNVPHYDAKGEADRLFIESGLPVTLLRTSFYWENLIYFGMGPQKGPDGKYYITFAMDDKKLPSMSSEDIGKCAYGIFKKGNQLVGQTVGIVGEKVSGQEMADALTKALGVEVRYNNVTPDTYRSFGFPGADELGNMLQFKRDFHQVYNDNRSEKLSRELNPEMKSFSQWLADNAPRIPLS